MGSRGIYKDGWFAGVFGPRNPWNPKANRLKDWDPLKDKWELYHVAKVNGKEAARIEVKRTVPAIFTASETFDVGMDLMSPVALDYHDQAPFAFNGQIEKIVFRYLP